MRPAPPEKPYVLLVEHVVEDEALAQRVLKKYHIANHVEWIKDGEEALRTMREWLAPGSQAGRRGIPQLVLLSASQTRLPALEVVRRLRALPGMEGVPVALCCDRPEDEKAARESGLPRLCPLSKPIGFFKLLECIQKMDMHWFVFAEKP